ncbi:8-amino-7-oxononanoate synthase [Kamptonema cortianum]|nr:8-amino-7-oxononanoate synthase [Kamptonema cortianum]
MDENKNMEAWLEKKLREIERKNLRRQLRVLDSPQGPEVRIDGRKLLNFSSNDYLGLAHHPLVSEAAAKAVEKFGAGAGASRLAGGNLRAQQSLDEQIARWKGAESVLSFSSGYAAAIGTLGAICDPNDVIVLDKLVHACCVDGAQASGATIRVYPHLNVGKLEEHLQWAREKTAKTGGKILVVTESVFSMDGDTAPLEQIVRLKEEYGAWLMLDEAHAIGVLGLTGAGLAEQFALQDKIEIQMGTLGKALGCVGGYIAGSRRLTDYLLHRARSVFFSTALPPAVCAAAGAAIAICSGPEGVERRERLQDNLRAWRKLPAQPDEIHSAICPVMVGEEARAQQIAQELFDAGFLVPAIRFPTVARGAARLRVSLRADHTREQIARLGGTLARLL